MAQSMSTDVIVNVYIGADTVDPNAVSIDITSVIMPGISEDNPAELELYNTLSSTLRERATRSSDYPQLERLLGERGATIQPTATGISISYRQYQQSHLNADPVTYYERSIVASDLAETILQNIFRTSPAFRGMTFDICYTYSHRLKLEQQLHDGNSQDDQHRAGITQDVQRLLADKGPKTDSFHSCARFAPRASRRKSSSTDSAANRHFSSAGVPSAWMRPSTSIEIRVPNFRDFLSISMTFKLVGEHLSDTGINQTTLLATN